MELRVPQTLKIIKVDGSARKRKAEDSNKSVPKGTVTGHNMHFITKTLKEMDMRKAIV